MQHRIEYGPLVLIIRLRAWGSDASWWCRGRRFAWAEVGVG